MTDDEMRAMPIPALQDEGLLFLWVTGRAMEVGRECLRVWGYTRIDEVVWVKTNQACAFPGLPGCVHPDQYSQPLLRPSSFSESSVQAAPATGSTTPKNTCWSALKQMSTKTETSNSHRGLTADWTRM